MIHSSLHRQLHNTLEKLSAAKDILRLSILVINFIQMNQKKPRNEFFRNYAFRFILLRLTQVHTSTSKKNKKKGISLVSVHRLNKGACANSLERFEFHLQRILVSQIL